MFQITFTNTIQIDPYEIADLLVASICRDLYNVILVDDNRKEYLYSMTFSSLTIRNNEESKKWIQDCIVRWYNQSKK